MNDDPVQLGNINSLLTRYPSAMRLAGALGGRSIAEKVSKRRYARARRIAFAPSGLYRRRLLNRLRTGISPRRAFLRLIDPRRRRRRLQCIPQTPLFRWLHPRSHGHSCRDCFRSSSEQRAGVSGQMSEQSRRPLLVASGYSAFAKPARKPPSKEGESYENRCDYENCKHLGR